MKEIQPNTTASQDGYPYWVPSGMDQGQPSIYDNVMMWLRSPRRWKDRNLKRYKNVRQSARKFKQTLDDFTPSDLRDDLHYSEFIDSLQGEIESSNLAQSTLDGYLGYLTGKVMHYGQMWISKGESALSMTPRLRGSLGPHATYPCRFHQRGSFTKRFPFRA